MKRILIGFAAAMCLTASVFASDVMTGGWEATAETAITDEVQEVFDKALKNSNDEKYEPIALLSTQVVAGMNYCFLCKIKDTVPSYAFVYVYEDVQGEASILEVQNIEFGVKGLEAEESEGHSDGEYAMGETWTVEGQWKLTIDSVEETTERNEYSELDPTTVYIVTFTSENLGYKDDYGSGLFLVLDWQIVDSDGKMGYSYPGNLTMYPQEVPIGARCTGQVCIGVDNPGPFKLYVSNYDGNGEYQQAIMDVEGQ